MSGAIPESELTLTKSFYDRISRAYDLLADASEHAARETGLQLLGAAPGERVLEIGFGTGQALLALARAVGEAGSVCGLDISEGMAEVASKRLQQAGLAGRVELRVAAAPPLPYDDGSFDAVFLSFTMELFPPDVIPRVATEARRVLRPGGRLGIVALATHPDGEEESLLERAYKWMHRHFPHIVDCRPIDVAGLLDRAGFAIVKQADMEIWTIPVKVVVGVPRAG